MTEIGTFKHELVNDKQDSIELTKNTKGWNYSIKLYGNLERNSNDIIKKLNELVIILEEKYKAEVKNVG